MDRDTHYLARCVVELEVAGSGCMLLNMMRGCGDMLKLVVLEDGGKLRHYYCRLRGYDYWSCLEFSWMEDVYKKEFLTRQSR